MSVCARERERAWPTKSLPMAEAKRAMASGRILSSAMNLARLNRRAVTPPVLLTCAGRGAESGHSQLSPKLMGCVRWFPKCD
jgi:hypothetical protein